MTTHKDIPENFIHFTSIPSTNDWLKDNKRAFKLRSPFLVYTDYQTNGKGQRGNLWESAAGKNILCSILVDDSFVIKNTQMLNWAACAAILDFLKSYLEGPMNIKWPNDILVKGKKIAGVLIENVYAGSTRSFSVVGIGLNLNQSQIDIPNTCSVFEFLQKELDVRFCVETLASNLYKRLNSSEQSLLNFINQNLYKINQSVTFSQNERLCEMEVISVSVDGSLQVKDQGEIKTITHPEYRWML